VPVERGVRAAQAQRLLLEPVVNAFRARMRRASVADETKETHMVSPIEIQKALGGMEYPADKDAIVTHAESSGAGDDVLEALRGLPDQRFEGPTNVNEAISNG
jgi:Protein of unknown function (DUF2795)